MTSEHFHESAGNIPGTCCIDRQPPVASFIPQEPGIQRGLAVNGKQWPNGHMITISFSAQFRQSESRQVMEWAEDWMKYANIRWKVTNERNANIRVSRDIGGGSWSYIGTDAQRIAYNRATLNLGFRDLDAGTVRHEFGHALSLAHEHQNPAGGIIWNEAVVYRDLAGPPNYWSREQTYRNVLRKYEVDQVNSTAFDPASVMLYAFPANWTRNMQGTQRNTEISEQDKQFIAELYPGRYTPEEPVEVQPPLSLPTQVIHTYPTRSLSHSEQRQYAFTAPKDGKYTLFVGGENSVAAKLYRVTTDGDGDDTLEVVGEKTDLEGQTVVSGSLTAGRHVLQLQGVGSYEIAVFLVE